MQREVRDVGDAALPQQPEHRRRRVRLNAGRDGAQQRALEPARRAREARRERRERRAAARGGAQERLARAAGVGPQKRLAQHDAHDFWRLLHSW